MKKLVSVFIIVVSFTITFSGCSIINHSGSSDDETDALCNAIILSIEENNPNDLKSLFSEEALEKCTDFEEGFAYTVNEYKGSLVKMKPISYTENAHYDDGKHFKEARALYSVETTEQSYFLYLDFYPSNTVEPAKEGLHTILLLDHRAEKDYSQYVGIYHPEWDKEVR